MQESVYYQPSEDRDINYPSEEELIRAIGLYSADLQTSFEQKDIITAIRRDILVKIRNFFTVGMKRKGKLPEHIYAVCKLAECIPTPNSAIPISPDVFSYFVDIACSQVQKSYAGVIGWIKIDRDSSSAYNIIIDFWISASFNHKYNQTISQLEV